MASNETISLLALAKELRVEPNRLPPLIIHSYLKLVESGPTPDECLVEKPPPAAMQWLKGMFAPLKKKPIIPTVDAAAILRISPARLRRYLVHYNISAQADPVFGEVLTIHQLATLYKNLYDTRNPLRTDRQHILTFLTGFVGVRLTPRKYSDRMCNEINRIAKLDEPLRTAQARALVEAWQDAKSVTDCLKECRAKMIKVHRRENTATLFRKIKILSDALDGKRSFEMPTLGPGHHIKSKKSERIRMRMMRYWGGLWEEKKMYLRAQINAALEDGEPSSES